MNTKLNSVPPWVAKKSAMDAMDDGQGPYCVWALDSDFERETKQALWKDFLVWVEDYFGQGYSLACVDGSCVDSVTHWAFMGFLAGSNQKNKGNN